jgi:hypothetical protein
LNQFSNRDRISRGPDHGDDSAPQIRQRRRRIPFSNQSPVLHHFELPLTRATISSAGIR